MVLIFFISLLNIEKTSKFCAASCKSESNLLLVPITVCIESCLLAGALLFDEKIRRSAVLFGFVLQDVGMLFH